MGCVVLYVCHDHLCCMFVMIICALCLSCSFVLYVCHDHVFLFMFRIFSWLPLRRSCRSGLVLCLCFSVGYWVYKSVGCMWVRGSFRSLLSNLCRSCVSLLTLPCWALLVHARPHHLNRLRVLHSPCLYHGDHIRRVWHALTRPHLQIPIRLCVHQEDDRAAPGRYGY